MQTGAEFAKTLPGGAAAEKALGISAGLPGSAAKELGKSIASEYAGPNARYGKSLKAEEQSLEHRGLIPEATDLASIVGPLVKGAGEAHAEALKASGAGKEEYAKVVAHREAVTHALQAPNVQEFLRRKDQIPTEPTKAEQKAAAKRESVEPRPNLRMASGSEAASLKPGGAVKEQPRSSNWNGPSAPALERDTFFPKLVSVP